MAGKKGTKTMNSRERVLRALEHKEPDRIPFDLGGMNQSGIHCIAYTELRNHLGLPNKSARIQNIIMQSAYIDKDFSERLKTDFRLVYSDWANPGKAEIHKEDGYLTYVDEWMINRIMPEMNGYYFDMRPPYPLNGDNFKELFKTYKWPDPLEENRYTGLETEAMEAGKSGNAVVLMGICPGIVEMYSWLRGTESFYMDLIAEQANVNMILDKLCDIKIAFWEKVLLKIGASIDIVNEADDMASQNSMLFSPEIYRKLIKPYHRRLFSRIKKAAPNVKIVFHSCGAVRPIIPDLIDIGIDALNPIQVNAKGMEPVELKREYGRDLCFWGGGIDTQKYLVEGSPEQIKDHVRQNIESLAPGGGYIFATTHTIQPGVPPENIMIMWDTLQRYGVY